MIHSVDVVLRSVGRSYPVLEAQRVPLRYAILPSRPTIVAAVQVCKSPVKVCLYVSLLSTSEKRVQKLRLHNRLSIPCGKCACAFVIEAISWMSDVSKYNQKNVVLDLVSNKKILKDSCFCSFSLQKVLSLHVYGDVPIDLDQSE